MVIRMHGHDVQIIFLLNMAYAIGMIKFKEDYVHNVRIEGMKLFVEKNKDLLLQAYEFLNGDINPEFEIDESLKQYMIESEIDSENRKIEMDLYETTGPVNLKNLKNEISQP